MIVALLTVAFSLSANAKLEQDSLKSYVRAQVLLSRFGSAEMQNLRNKVLTLPQEINKSVVGQNDLAYAIQTRVFQYLNSLGSRTGEPVAIHMIGLAGIGKTSIIKVLEEQGFPIYKIGAEHYPGGDNASGSEWRLMEALERAASLQTRPDLPLIVFIDEIDKVPEMTSDGPIPQPVISSLNEILSEGELRAGRNLARSLKFHNILIMTAMNFAPSQIEMFASEIVKTQKSYWQFNEEDMRTFDKWIRSGDQADSSKARLLEQLFRSNTVSRLVPDTMVAKALFSEDFDGIVDMNLRDVTARLTQDKRAALQVATTPEFRNFLRKHTTFAPSGARMSVKRIDLLTEQLVSIASRADTGDVRTLALPRSIRLHFDPVAEEARVTVQALSKNGNKVRIAGEKEFSAKYNRAAGSFVIPEGLIHALPEGLAQKTAEFADDEASTPATSTETRAQRLALRNDHALAKYLKTIIHDQDKLVDEIDHMLHLYMNTEEEAVRYLAVAGFPGVGKTRTIMAAAERLGIPVVKMTMQDYSGDSQESSESFVKDLEHKIQRAREESETGKYIVLFDDIDKANEINPQDLTLVNRPVMGAVKTLLSEGHLKVLIKTDYSSELKTIDIRDSAMFLTMNFGFDRFDVVADPRITTIHDMEDIYREISNSPVAMRKILATMFQPETINRILEHFIVSRPLTEKGYEQIIKDQIPEVLRLLGSGEESVVNTGAFRLRPTRNYLKNYVFKESVIPSEGGRDAQDAAKTIFLKDALRAIQHLPKESPLIRRPIDILLDFKPKNAKHGPLVSAEARLSDKEDRKKNGGDHRTPLFIAERQLKFPPTVEFGKMSSRRAFVAVHEFGHAFSAVFLGARFETAICEMPDQSGLVKGRHKDIHTGYDLLANILWGLGSRAMERIMLAEDPRNPASVLKITNGPVADIGQITKEMWNFIYQFGLDPGGGVIERSGLGGDKRNDYQNRTYHFEGLSDKRINEMGLVLRDMEDFLVDQLLKLHSKEWYRNRITAFGLAGQMTEHEFYDLVGYAFPGENSFFIGEQTNVDRKMASVIKDEPESVTFARKFKMENGLTAAENMENAVTALKISLAKRLHKGDTAETCAEMVSFGPKRKPKKGT